MRRPFLRTKPFLTVISVFLLPSVAAAAGTSILVAVIDTGLYLAHPVFSGKIYVNPGETAADGLDNDGNGFIDDVNGWDFYGNDNNPSGSSGNGAHGTQSAGRVVQGALDALVSILPLRVGPGPSLSLSAILQAVDYAIGQGARIISMSFGTTVSSSSLQDAMRRASDAGVLLVASAGNGGNTTPNYPAAYSQVVSVAATDDAGHKASFSTYGGSVDLSAPGEDVTTATWGGGNAVVSGTSFSAPFVAGVMARILSALPDLTPGQVMSKLLEFVKDVDALNPSYDGQLGRGLVDEEVAAAVADGLPLGDGSSGDEERTRLEQELENAQQELAGLEQDLEAVQQELNDALQAQEEAAAAYSQAQKNTKTAQRNYDALKKAYKRTPTAELAQQVAEALKVLEDARKAEQGPADQLRAAQAAVKAIKKRISALQNQIDGVRDRIAGIEQELANLSFSADVAQEVLGLRQLLEQLSRPVFPAGLGVREVPVLSVPEAGSSFDDRGR